MTGNTEFVHLHLHDQYSILDGYGKASQYCELANKLGYKAMALTNHGNVDGVIKWQQACKAAGIKSIIGVEVYMVPDLRTKKEKERRYHAVLLAKNTAGFHSLLKMLTVANLDGFYHRPRIDPALLLEHCSDLVVGGACLESYINMEGGIDLLKQLDKKTEVYLEVMPHAMREQVKFNQHVLRVAADLKVPVVATNDCHYPEKQHAKLQEVLLAMQSKKKWKDKDRWKFDIDTLWLTSVEEMHQLFEKQGALTAKQIDTAMSATADIAKLCNLTIERQPVYLPRPPVPGKDHLGEEDQLISLTTEGFERRKRIHNWIDDSNSVQYRERLSEELQSIIAQGFARYFLIVWELIAWCHKNDIMVGPGRGSSGGSLVAFCLNITQVDPIKYNLVFSRFISDARIDLPDIDMDFEDTKRDKIMQHLKELYGEYNVISISTFAKLKGKGVVRNVSRVFDVPLADVNKAAECIVVRSGGDMRSDFCVKDAFETFEEGKAFQKKYPEVSQIAIELEGQIYSTGKHAAAMVVSADDLRSGKNAAYAARSQSIVANWEKEDAEYMGLMKLDVLGLNSLTLLSECRKLITSRHGKDIDYETLPLDDTEVFKQFSAGNGIGIFQFNSPGMMRLCREIGVEDFDEVVKLNTLHRPGSLRSGIVTQFEARKHGTEPVTYIHPFIEEITKESYGLIIYQEQVMRFLYDLGGLPWKTTDTIRKVISKSKGVEQFLSFKQQFIDGCLKRGTLEADMADKMFDELKFFGSYSFNKSHSVEYSLIGYWMMWLKVHYPAEFMATILTHGQDHKKADNIQEARRLGLKILLPDINRSEAKQWTIDQSGNLLTPLSEVKGVGEVASAAIVAERDRNGPYKDFGDLESRVEKRRVNSKVRGLLNATLCFGDDECRLQLDESKLEELSQYFDFSLSNDPTYRYRKMLSKLSEHINVLKLNTIEPGLKHKKENLYFGVIDKLKFGFKMQGDGKKIMDVRGTVGDLGGVYSNFKDDTDFIMLVFEIQCYQKNKSAIEHSEGKWMLVRARNVHGRNNIHASAVWFGDDMLAGKVSGLGLKLAKPAVYPKGFLQKHDGLYLPGCSECALRQECSAPVLPSAGQFNMMIVGEAPGRDEDRLKRGFVGDSGNALWKRLGQYGLEREMFHVTNIAKCWPSKTRTPKPAHIKACSKYLINEIETVKPFVILSFGNTGLKFFKEQESGIMAASGSCEWSDQFNCWVVYSVHPAAALYSPENKEYVDRGVEAFVERVAQIGFGAD